MPPQYNPELAQSTMQLGRCRYKQQQHTTKINTTISETWKYGISTMPIGLASTSNFSNAQLQTCQTQQIGTCQVKPKSQSSQPPEQSLIIHSSQLR